MDGRLGLADTAAAPLNVGPGGPPQDVLETWLRGQRGLAESLGEWAFYAAAALIALALIKRFPITCSSRPTNCWR